MRGFIIFTGLLITSFSASSQSIKTAVGVSQSPVEKKLNEQDDKLLYGPLPYRTLQETVGETYITLELTRYNYSGYEYLFKKGNNKYVGTSVSQGKKIKLISLTEDEGTFIDSAGVEFTCRIFRNRFPQLAPLTDIEGAKKLLIGKSLWLNINKYPMGRPENIATNKVVTGVRFSKVKVTNVEPSGSNDIPVRLVILNENNETGYVAVNISGTNTDIDLPSLFTQQFFTENPQTKYKLSDKTWAAVKAGRTEIGMPMDAVQLIEGRPTKRNKSVIGNIRKEQWVYGETAIQSYFYFENGKLTAISR